MTKDIQVKHEIIKTPISFKHITQVTYPKLNVANMKKKWEESISDSQQFLESAGEARKAAEAQGLAEIDAEGKRIKTRIEELSALNREERAEALLKEFEAFVLAEHKNLEMLDKRKAEYLVAIEGEIKKQQQYHRENLKTKKDALDLWTNYTTE